MTEAGLGTMHRRRVVLSDGRYLIFYTFDDATTPPPDDSQRRTNFENALPGKSKTPVTAEVRRED
jgi:hypothetical protein